MRKNPINGVEGVEWKKCNTANQACVYCGEKMDKGYIELMLKSKTGNKNVNLWVHAGCSYHLGKLLLTNNPQLRCRRIGRHKPDGKKKCLVCERVVVKNKKPVAWVLDNKSDGIKTKKELIFHDDCRDKLAKGLKFPLYT
jgi:hypothetical protein